MKRGPERFRQVIHGQAAGSGSKTPMPKGRMVGARFQPVLDRIGRPVFYVKPSSEKTEPWMKKVREECELTWARRAPLDGALWLDVIFLERRIAGHYFHRKSGRVLRPDAPAHPHQTDTHDHDKMRRAICDSLKNAGVIVDDKRVIGGESWKDYAENHGEGVGAQAIIHLGVMAEQTAADLGLASQPDPDNAQAALV